VEKGNFLGRRALGQAVHSGRQLLTFSEVPRSGAWFDSIVMLKEVK
jgi:hypothetical protein